MDSSLDARMQAYRDAGVRQVVLGLADIDGVIRGKFVDLSMDPVWVSLRPS